MTVIAGPLARGRYINRATPITFISHILRRSAVRHHHRPGGKLVADCHAHLKDAVGLDVADFLGML